MRHGHGVYICNHGDKYIGQWVNDLRHGKGMYIEANGEVFMGEYKEDERIEIKTKIRYLQTITV